MSDLHSVQRPISELPIVAKMSILGSPDWVGIDTHAVWISNKAKNSITRIDPGSNQIVATVAVSNQPCAGLAVGFGSVWVPSCQDHCVDRVDTVANTVIARVPLAIADSEGSLGIGGGAVWMPTDIHGTISRIDPAVNQVVAHVKTSPQSFVAIGGAGSVWVSSTGNDLVSRIDPETNMVTACIPVGPSPRFMASSENVIWVLNQGDGTVSRIDPESNTVIATIDTGHAGPGGDIAFGEGAVWVTTINVPLTRIDPTTNKVSVQFVGEGGDALRIGHGSVWLCSFFLQEVWRVRLPL